ncbi:MAG: polysaccharide biosynthesis/export family protein, partial [Opitutales bacterium]|nr:polysaccharide biosynthesis/export family protein [Opitutales bacterium]
AYFDASVLKDPTGYKLRPGDRIRVVIQGEVDCSLETSLTNEGTINMPYVGEIRLMGKNKKEAESSIEREYKKELIFARPNALLNITKYSERVVFLTGSVNRKGPYVLPPEVEAMNIVEVIARAGGFNDIAKKNRVYVTRTFFDESGNPTNTKTYEVDVEALSSGIQSGNSSRRFWIYPGDRIEVPERLL